MRKTSLSVFAITVAASGCAASSTATKPTSVAGLACGSLGNVQQEVASMYAPQQVTHVEPLRRTQFLARAIQPEYVAGAKLHVPAQRGVTEAYLERVLSCHAASGAAGNESDPLLAANVRDIDVVARGARFVITVEGTDRAAGSEIWRRARALSGDTEVEVRQLSSAKTPSRL